MSRDTTNDTTDHSEDSDNEHDDMASAPSARTRPQENETDDDGNEYHYAAAGHAELHGSDLHNNVLVGSNSSRNTLTGGARDDVLDGADGDDDLQGGDGDDVMIGGDTHDAGHNHLNGGTGSDILVAGGARTQQMGNLLAANPALGQAIQGNQKFAGLSAFVGNSATGSGHADNVIEEHSNGGHDLVLNFHAETDTIQIDRDLNGSGIRDLESLVDHMTVSGNNVTFDLGNGNAITLVGVDLAGLGAHNIVFV